MKKILCKACGNTISGNIDTYKFCDNCGTANYISSNTAEYDNKKYFDKFYSDEKYEITSRRKTFFCGEKINNFLFKKEIHSFIVVYNEISKIIINANKVVEVGFGSGDELVKYLTLGANMYGIDISSEAVKNFKHKYPMYADRVESDTKFNDKFDVVYSNALFEHLDEPDEFLNNAFNQLSTDGYLIIRMPLINENVKIKEDKDINLWKPCHRALYTKKGLDTLLANNKFQIINYSRLNYYGYKVMNKMLKMGYEDIEYVRNPYFKVKNLNSDIKYSKILLMAIFNECICSDSIIIAKKIK